MRFQNVGKKKNLILNRNRLTKIRFESILNVALKIGLTIL